jgi:DNA polymerase phi
LAGYNEIISQLVLLGEKKSWLRESAWWSISLALDALHASDASWKEEAVDVTIKRLFVDTKIWTPEKVALVLILQASYPERDWRDHLSPAFKIPEILSTGNLTMLARILKVS